MFLPQCGCLVKITNGVFLVVLSLVCFINIHSTTFVAQSRKRRCQFLLSETFISFRIIFEVSRMVYRQSILVKIWAAVLLYILYIQEETKFTQPWLGSFKWGEYQL